MATITHNGKNIPTASPKDPDSDVWYGFTWPLSINGSLATAGQTVDGLKFEASVYAEKEAKINISGGTEGQRYTLTNRLATTETPSDDRSMYITVVNL